VVLSDGEPRVTAAGTKGSATFLTHLSKKRTLPFQYLDDEWRARKLLKKPNQSTLAF